MLQFVTSASSIQLASWVFGTIFGGAILGFVVRYFLPEHHYSKESKDASTLVAGLVATLAALILGLLIASTKGTFDQISSLMNNVATDYVHVDRLLSDYGPEAAPIRNELRGVLELRIRTIWPEEFKKVDSVPVKQETRSGLEKIFAQVAALKPVTPYQITLQDLSLRLVDGILHDRWMITVIGQGSIPPLLLVIPVIWITFLTFLYALFAPRNLTVIVVLFFCSLSIAGAIFLIDEMATPLDGFIKVSSAPLHLALDRLGK